MDFKKKLFSSIGKKEKKKSPETDENPDGVSLGDEMFEKIEKEDSDAGKREKGGKNDLKKTIALGIVAALSVAGYLAYEKYASRNESGGDLYSGSSSGFASMSEIPTKQPKKRTGGKTLSGKKSGVTAKKESGQTANLGKKSGEPVEERPSFNPLKKRVAGAEEKENTPLVSKNGGAEKTPGVSPVEIPPEKAAKKAVSADETITTIEKEIPDDSLSGVGDPIAAIDKKVVNTRSYNEYLSQKLALLSKLTEYYKRKKKLEELMRLFKEGYKKKNADDEIEKRAAERALMAVNEKIKGLSGEIRVLKARLESERKKKREETAAGYGEISKEVGTFEGFNIFVKDGRYVAVVKTPHGEKIFRKGAYYKGFKIADITSDAITFEKNGVKYIYSGESATDEYAVVNIPLAGGKPGEDKFIGKEKGHPSGYVPKPSGSEVARMLLDKSLRKGGR